MDIKEFLHAAKGFQMIVDKIAELATDGGEDATADLCGFVLVKDDIPFDKLVIPALACRGILDRGPDGVRLLAALLEKAEGAILPNVIVECLWCTANGELDPATDMRRPSQLPPILERVPGAATIEAARGAFRDFVISAQSNQAMFEVLTHFLNMNKIKSLLTSTSAEVMRSEVFHIIRESSIKITKSLLNQFESLLSENLREEAYQVFLAQNPVFLDPLASRVIPKQSLGLEFKTDYVIQRLDNQYFAVEIEKPQDSMFTRADDFSSEFTHGFGQVIDFLEWVDSHAEYARHHMPGISSPRGILVMGMRSQLSQRQAAKLKRLCINTPNIEVFTFDDLLRRAETLYSNMRQSTGAT